MTGSDDLMRPAERALGLEPDDGPETEAERRMREEWEHRLVPLALAMPPVPPPAALFARIERQINAEDVAARVLLDLGAARAARNRWRRASLAFGALAAAMAGLVVLSNLEPPLTAPGTPLVVSRAADPAPASRYLAVVTAAGGPSVVIDFDLARGMATLRPVGVTVPEGHALELWRIEPGKAPVSHGLLDAGHLTRAAFPAAPGDTIALTLEPPGGAPNGAPSGPPILSGPVIALPE